MLYKLIWQLFGTAVDNGQLLHILQPERYGLRITHDSITHLGSAYLPCSCLILEHEQEWATHCPDATYQQAFFDCKK